MSFEYDVMSEEEAIKAREFELLPDGVYSFAVTEAKSTYSQSGNPMIALKLRIIHDGKEVTVFDNLIGTKNMTWKTKHFCDSTGLQAEYNGRTFGHAIALHARGTCAIGNVPARPKNDGSGGTWKAKNEVTDYLSSEAMAKASAENPFAPPAPPAPPAPKAAAVDPEPFIDSDLPF